MTLGNRRNWIKPCHFGIKARLLCLLMGHFRTVWNNYFSPGTWVESKNFIPGAAPHKLKNKLLDVVARLFGFWKSVWLLCNEVKISMDSRSRADFSYEFAVLSYTRDDSFQIIWKGDASEIQWTYKVGKQQTLFGWVWGDSGKRSISHAS